MAFPSFSFDGQATTQVFTLVPRDPTPPVVVLDLPEGVTRDCCNAFAIKALADTGSTDDFKNDRAGFLWWFDSLVTTADLTLQKYSNTTNDFEDLIALNNGTYGTFYAYAFFTNTNGEKFIGYQLNWKDVLTIHGEGGYRVKCEPTTILGTTELLSPNYCLKQYTPNRADVTVRLEYYLNNILGLSDNDYNTRDLGNLDWYNGFRLPGFFGFPGSDYENDFIEYNNGQRQWVQNDQEVEYVLKLKPTPAFIHELMRTDVLQADRIYVTDYNSKNPQTFIDKQVINSGPYRPDWKKLQSKLATVEASFRQEYNNLQKKRC